MTFRLGYGFLFTIIFFSVAPAEVVRFQTDVGDIDMVLNPTKDPRLQEHVDNLIDYVDARRYHCTVINRAAEGFVLQMGSFSTTTLIPPKNEKGFESIDTFAPITGVPASTTSRLTNTRGTVAMALPGLPGGGTNQNGGTSSFFVNLDDNSTSLDPDFTVFAQIPDMETVDKIMGLKQVDLTQDPGFGANFGNLAFRDIPLQGNGNQVFIQKAFLLEDPLAIASATRKAISQVRNPNLVSPLPTVASTAAPDITPTISSSTTTPTIMSTPPAVAPPRHGNFYPGGNNFRNDQQCQRHTPSCRCGTSGGSGTNSNKPFDDYPCSDHPGHSGTDDLLVDGRLHLDSDSFPRWKIKTGNPARQLASSLPA